MLLVVGYRLLVIGFQLSVKKLIWDEIIFLKYYAITFYSDFLYKFEK